MKKLYGSLAKWCAGYQVTSCTGDTVVMIKIRVRLWNAQVGENRVFFKMILSPNAYSFLLWSRKKDQANTSQLTALKGSETKRSVNSAYLLERKENIDATSTTGNETVRYRTRPQMDLYPIFCMQASTKSTQNTHTGCYLHGYFTSDNVYIYFIYFSVITLYWWRL